MVFFGSEFKPACNGVNTAWFAAVSREIHGAKVFWVIFGILSIVLGIFFTF